MYDGTWASGPWPSELVDFEVMREMRWTWRELQDTPLYVRRFCADFVQLRRKAQLDADERAIRSAQQAAGGQAG